MLYSVHSFAVVHEPADSLHRKGVDAVGTPAASHRASGGSTAQGFLVVAYLRSSPKTAVLFTVPSRQSFVQSPADVTHSSVVE